MTTDLLEELELSLAWPTERRRGGLSLLLELCWAEEPTGESNRRERELIMHTHNVRMLGKFNQQNERWMKLALSMMLSQYM